MSGPANDGKRRLLFPDDVAPAQLHAADEPLRAAIDRCSALGWAAVHLSADRWTTNEALHDEISAALSFPDHYGRNLDALVDQMQSLPLSVEPRFASASGLAIAIRGVDKLVAIDPLRVKDIIDIFVEGAVNSLRYGWPIAVLLQSDDPDIQLPPRAVTAIPWNRAERNRSDRV